MSDVLSPVSSSGLGTAGREPAMGGQGGAFAAQAKGAESAAAVRPVDPIRDARDARMDRTRDLPVGPAPTFQRNVLQDMRDNWRAIATKAKDAPDGASGEGRGQAEGDAYQALSSGAGPRESGGQTLDLKV